MLYANDLQTGRRVEFNILHTIIEAPVIEVKVEVEEPVKEVFRFPPTFTSSETLDNTGTFVIDFSEAIKMPLGLERWNSGNLG